MRERPSPAASERLVPGSAPSAEARVAGRRGTVIAVYGQSMGASAAVIGVLGTALLHAVVLVTMIAVRGVDPIRRAGVSRRFVPEVVTEGDPVIEELRFTRVRVPIGFRLFVRGRVGPRWAEPQPTQCVARCAAHEHAREVALAAQRRDRDQQRSARALWQQQGGRASGQEVTGRVGDHRIDRVEIAGTGRYHALDRGARLRES